jgi:hypothetical protein
MRSALSFLAGSFGIVEEGEDGVRRVFTWRKEDATEATVRGGAPFVSLLTLLE